MIACTPFRESSQYRTRRPNTTGTLDSENHTARFMLTKDCIVFDHAESKLYISQARCSRTIPTLNLNMKQRLLKDTGTSDHIDVLSSSNKVSSLHKRNKTEKTVEYIPSVSKETFEISVKKIKEHIVAGDIFQAVLSRRIECAVNRDPFAIYEASVQSTPARTCITSIWR